MIRAAGAKSKGSCCLLLPDYSRSVHSVKEENPFRHHRNADINQGAESGPNKDNILSWR